MPLIPRMTTLALLVGTTPAWAGGWSSQSGGLITDELNPWFIDNTKTVEACIEVDAEHFHLPPNISLERDVIGRALAYWQTQLHTEGYSDTVRLATQAFHFGPCSDRVDVRFQFGVLSTEQRAGFTRDPRHFISAAIRTDYDQQTMHGRGFIYVAPDSGDLAPVKTGLRPQPWSAFNGVLLVKVLAHELGHVFGLQHTPEAAVRGSSSYTNLMAATFPEDVLKLDPDYDEAAWRYSVEGGRIPPVVTDDGGSRAETFGMCVGGDIAQYPVQSWFDSYYGFPTDSHCTVFWRMKGALTVSNAVPPGPCCGDMPAPSRVGIGTVQLGEAAVTHADYVVRLWFPSGSPLGRPGFQPAGPRRQVLTQIGTYQDDLKIVKHRIMVTTEPGGFSVSSLDEDLKPIQIGI